MTLESVRSSWFLLYFDNFTTFHSRSIKHFTLWCIYPLKTTRSEAHKYIYKSSSFIYLNRIDCPACTSSTTRTTSATSNRSVTWTCAKAHIKWTSTTHATVKKANRPSQDWKAGQKLPSAYHSNAYKVDHQKYKKLSKPGKNQQWIKVNGDYVLTDIRNHSIIKIIAG